MAEALVCHRASALQLGVAEFARLVRLFWRELYQDGVGLESTKTPVVVHEAAITQLDKRAPHDHAAFAFLASL